MKPGTTIPPFASKTRADFFPRASFAISALEPTAMILSPLSATPVAHGCFGLAVHTRAFTIASVSCCWFVIVVAQADWKTSTAASTARVADLIRRRELGPGARQARQSRQQARGARAA